MQKPSKPLKEMTERELTEYNLQIQFSNQEHLKSIKGWMQFLGIATITSIVIAIIALYGAGVLK